MGQRRARLIGLLALSPFAAGVGPLGPAHTVCASGCDYTQIQPALDASANGDRVFVYPGAYPGGLTFRSDVSLVGIAGSSATLIAAPPIAAMNYTTYH